MKNPTQPSQHVASWRASGLTQADYCRQQAINPKTFSKWTRDELHLDQDIPFQVIPVQVAPSPEIAAAPTPLILRFKQGTQLELSTAVPPRWLAELLRCLA